MENAPSEKVARGNGNRDPSPSKAGVAEQQQAKSDQAPDATQKAVSIGDQIKALLVDFNSVEAKKAIESFSVSDLQAALALSASLPKDYARDSLRWAL